MPLVYVETNLDLNDPTEIALKLSKIVSLCLKKPEKYVTVSIRKSITITRGGMASNFAIIEVRSIGGITVESNNLLSRNISAIFIDLGLDSSMIDLNFSDILPQNWGKSSGTFA